MKDDCSVEHARAVVVSLAKLHARFWNSERFMRDLAWLRPRTRRYGAGWLEPGFSQTRRAFLDTATEELLPNSMRPLLQRWDECALRVFEYQDATLPYTVLHGDSHLGNTFSRADGSSGLFDWQVAYRGNGVRDLAYFISSAMSSDMRSQYEREVFDLYLETLAGQGISIDPVEAWDNYCIFVLDGWDAAIMSLIHGSYNHEGLDRGCLSVAGFNDEHDLLGRLETLMRKLD